MTSRVEIPYKATDKRIYIDVQFSNPIEKDKIYSCKAVVDTGATISAFTPRVVAALCFECNDEDSILVQCVGKPVLMDFYHAGLSIPEIGFAMKETRILEIKGDRKGYDAILGMDILSQCTFKFENDIFTLCSK